MTRQPRASPKTDFGKPIPWIIVVDAMTYEKAREVGTAIGSCGVTGLFLTGTQADNLQKYAEWRRAEKLKGGDDDAEKN